MDVYLVAFKSLTSYHNVNILTLYDDVTVINLYEK